MLRERKQGLVSTSRNSCFETFAMIFSPTVLSGNMLRPGGEGEAATEIPLLEEGKIGGGNYF